MSYQLLDESTILKRIKLISDGTKLQNTTEVNRSIGFYTIVDSSLICSFFSADNKTVSRNEQQKL